MRATVTRVPNRLNGNVRYRSVEPDAGACRDRSREAHPVEPVVEDEVGVVDDEELVKEASNRKREGQHSVGDRASERPGFGAFAVDVDPLVILGRGGERVDALLADDEPARGAELDAGEPWEVGHVNRRSQSPTRPS